MLPLLVWLAGCVFGFWAIFHFGLWREAMSLAVCGSVFLWVVGGASWIGKKLQADTAARAAGSGQAPPLPGMKLSDQDRELLKRAAEARSAQGS